MISLPLACVVICSEEQKQQAGATACTLKAQGADLVVLVAPTSCSFIGVDCIVSEPPFSGFSAGYNRDQGVQYVLNTYGPCDFLFIDGDCIPSENLVQHHKKLLSYCNNVICCGLRVNKSPTGTLRVDRRLGHPATRMRLFVHGVDRVLLNAREIISHSAAWSCNLSVSYEVVMSVIKTNKVTQQTKQDRLFHPVFDGKWGGEDTLLGVQSFRAGARVVFLDPDESHVVHVDHPTNAHDTENLRLCVKLCMDTLSSFTSTCTVTVRKIDGRDPVPDTWEFYNNLVDVQNPDPVVTELARRLKTRTPAEDMALQYLFSPVPACRYITEAKVQSVPAQRVLELFNQARTEVVTLQDLGVCK